MSIYDQWAKFENMEPLDLEDIALEELENQWDPDSEKDDGYLHLPQERSEQLYTPWQLGLHVKY